MNISNNPAVEKYSDKSILDGIRQRKNIILEYIYNEYFPQILRIVVRHGGDEQDARDLFQEGLIIIFNKLAKGELEIKTSFHNYFIVICRFLWFRHKNVSHNIHYDRIEDELSPASWDSGNESGISGEIDLSDEIDESTEREETDESEYSDQSAGTGISADYTAYQDTSSDAAQEGIGDSEYIEYLNNQSEKIYQRHYRKLPGDCKRVIKMFLKKRPFREIASIMKYGSEEYGRRKKYLCMQQLMNLINDDPEYIELQRIKRSREE
ncbi:MAG: sigma-70 family RNA polymerase sigma factor [Marinilabiliales bacterium]|nr:MAG: sigma-70 family RNA polymerase sigma factor [Marinilabiliales bacterium]